MKQPLKASVEVPALEHKDLDLDTYAELLDGLPVYPLANNSWPEYQTGCSASFSIAHIDTAILLKFYVKNDHFKTRLRAINTAVNKDNCVEFFVAFGGDVYYNIEFNCLGTGKIASGTKRKKRQFLEPARVREVGVMTKTDHFGDQFNWQITLYIPTSIFESDRISSLKGLTCKGNFYKCGDDLPEPHFLCWNAISNQEPNFHLPEYFGDIIFH